MSNNDSFAADSTPSLLKLSALSAPIGRMLDKSKRVYKYVGRRSVGFLLLGVVSSFCLGAVELLIASFIQEMLRLFGFVSSGEATLRWQLADSIWSLSFVLVGIGLVRLVLQVLSNQSIYFSSELFNSRLRGMAIRDYMFHLGESKSQSADLFFRFTEIIPRAGSALNAFSILLMISVQCLTIYIAMMACAWREGLAATVGIGVIGVVVLSISRSIGNINRLVPEESRVLSTRVQKASRNLLLFRILRTQAEEYEKLMANLINYAGLLIRTQALTTLTGSLGGFLGVILLAILTILAKTYWNTESGSFLAFLYLFIRFVQSLTTVSSQIALLRSSHSQFSMALDHFESLHEVDRHEATKRNSQLGFYGIGRPMDNARRSVDRRPDRIVEQNPNPPSISLENVSFAYSDRQKSILPVLNLQIESGKQLGIMGPSGSGKSTLLMLILGILKPTAGKITVGGVSPNEYFAAGTKSVGYVGAEPFLFAASLRENLLYGSKRTVSDEEIYEAIKLANLTSLVKEVGLDYEISDDHSGISAGQKQRLCLARAVLLRPKLLILDEVSANLDASTEQEIAAAIRLLKGSTTVLSVSHRAGLLAFADEILDLGKLVGEHKIRQPTE